MQDCISKITDLRSQLEIIQSEVRELRTEHQRAADEHARAILINDQKVVEECKAFEGRAMKVIKEKNEIIGGLQSEIEEEDERESLKSNWLKQQGGLKQDGESQRQPTRLLRTAYEGKASPYLRPLSRVVQASMDGMGWEAGFADSIGGKVRERARSELVFNCCESLPDAGSGGDVLFSDFRSHLAGQDWEVHTCEGAGEEYKEVKAQQTYFCEAP